MNLTQLTSADLKQIVKLLEQKETLQSRVAKIDAELAAYEGSETAKTVKGKPRRKPRAQAQAKPAKTKRVKRGALKAAIVELLKGAGKSGITVKDLSGKLGLGYSRVFAWFYKTGTNIKEIKKAGPGKYTWTGAK
jgi:conjugal transfer/entry exclusion protein